MTEYTRLSGVHFLTIQPRPRAEGSFVARLSRATYRALGCPERVELFVSGDHKGLLVVPDDEGRRVHPYTLNFGAARLRTVFRAKRTARYPVTITEHDGKPAALVTLKAMSQ